MFSSKVVRNALCKGRPSAEYSLQRAPSSGCGGGWQKDPPPSDLPLEILCSPLLYLCCSDDDHDADFRSLLLVALLPLSREHSADSRCAPVFCSFFRLLIHSPTPAWLCCSVCYCYCFCYLTYLPSLLPSSLYKDHQIIILFFSNSLQLLYLPSCKVGVAIKPAFISTIVV